MTRQRRPWSVATKLLAIGGVLGALLVLAIGQTLWVAWHFEGSAAAVNEAGRMRMQVWRLATMLQAGTPDDAQALGRTFDDSIELLREGDALRPLFVPWNADTRARFDEVVRGWDGLRALWLGAATPPPSRAAEQADAFVASVDRFVLAIEHELARLTAILNLSQMAMMALALGGAVVLLYTGYLLVIEPLGRLRSGLHSVERGDFDTRVEVTSLDEFGQLARGFNRMSATLQSLYRGLEDRVREKTARLQEQSERLAALYEVSLFLGEAATLDELARGFAQKVRRIARADAAAIRWSDEANQRYLLLAGDCLPTAMAHDERCVPSGTCHCGQPLSTAANARVVPIVPDGGATLGCAREGFESLVTVPLHLQQRVLGEVDLFYRHPVTLGDDERGVLEALAHHLASAMESLRVAALERESAVAEERGLLARELHDSIAQSLSFLKIQVQLLRQATQRGDGDAVARALDELDAGVRESTADVRELLVHFRTRTQGEHIEPALRTTLRKFEHQSGLRTHLQVEGHGLPLPPDVQVQVLHVIQEALSNVRKHAEAREVWVEVQAAPQWRFEVRDDGVGFDADAPHDETHVGLGIMHERARRIGAQVQVDAVPGAGTCVTLTLPSATPPAAVGAPPAAVAA
ncbi:type IV pili methyl-accepting chemotaxis transducer N-terminal domain-containing protein [Azohydromonas sp.]|uniref:type IV pili methyl-accepting chemotaxis transducer N-terminal domain-containing protein n=1 Tax=Azohydromonas sp. TaxID=1872666 RepID=UPI002C7FB702|nr:type IV pili methyl-accepting chemotaxis transducer N-terminal domain-containing protein [Azohydromonas sp.]HMM86173.1 type IV pili methyl-accepting chemotaxis transducer N-terminal domain-containing protein [Azohydromonas sp.]